jgi:hypothetical protein
MECTEQILSLEVETEVLKHSMSKLGKLMSESGDLGEANILLGVWLLKYNLACHMPFSTPFLISSISLAFPITVWVVGRSITTPNSRIPGASHHQLSAAAPPSHHHCR